MVAAELRRVPACAGAQCPSAVAEPVTDSGAEEDRRAGFEIAAVIEGGVDLADPVGGVPEVKRPVEASHQARLVRDLDALRRESREIRVAGIAAAANDVLPADGGRTSGPV